ncbi:hypothetical protein EDB19DRAFT_1669160, partial [Suillus lakei]
METNDFVAFIIFWVVCLLLLLLKPESCILIIFSVMPALNHTTINRYRVPAIISAALVLIAALAVFLWLLSSKEMVVHFSRILKLHMESEIFKVL